MLLSLYKEVGAGLTYDQNSGRAGNNASSQLQAPCLTQRSSYCLCGDVHAPYIWVSSGFSGFRQCPKEHAGRWDGCAKLPLACVTKTDRLSTTLFCILLLLVYLQIFVFSVVVVVKIQSRL